MRKISLWALCFVFVVLMSGSALADTYTVSVGYADGLRGPGFFPNPWFGDAGVTFIGSGAPYDAGAVMITNTSGSTITVNDVEVRINGNFVDPISVKLTRQKSLAAQDSQTFAGSVVQIQDLMGRKGAPITVASN